MELNADIPNVGGFAISRQGGLASVRGVWSLDDFVVEEKEGLIPVRGDWV